MKTETELRATIAADPNPAVRDSARREYALRRALFTARGTRATQRAARALAEFAAEARALAAFATPHRAPNQE